MGRSPSTRVEGITMVQSHNATLLDPAEFKHINNNAYPIVFAYNGRDHFCPTKFCTTAQYNHWKTQKELGSLLGASMHVQKLMWLNSHQMFVRQLLKSKPALPRTFQC